MMITKTKPFPMIAQSHIAWCCLAFAFVVSLSSCSSYDRNPWSIIDPWDRYEIALTKGLHLPREKSGGCYTYDIPWVSSVYKDGNMSYYEMGDGYEVISANLSTKEEGTPFLVYFDRQEQWSILCDIAKEIQSKNSELFYVACQVSNEKEPVRVESYQIKYKDTSSLSNIATIEIHDNDKVVFSQKEYPDYMDFHLVEDIVDHSKKNTSCLFFLRGRGNLSVEKFINTLAYIESYTGLDVYVETKTQ